MIIDMGKMEEQNEIRKIEMNGLERQKKKMNTEKRKM